jgi:hypothetical protein
MKKYLLFLLQSFKNADTWFWGLLSLFNLIFVLYILNVGIYNRPSDDDFALLYFAHKIGALQLTIDVYSTWSGRVAPVFLSGVFFWLHDKGVNLGWFTGFLTLGMISVFYSIFNKIITPYLLGIEQPYFRKFIVLNLACFLFAFYVLNLYSPSSFFWIVATVLYSYGLLAAAILFRQLLNTHFNLFTTIFVIPLSAFYAAGSSENFAAVWLLLLTLLLFFIIIASKQKVIFEKYLLPVYQKLSTEKQNNLIYFYETYIIKALLLLKKINLPNLILSWIISCFSFLIMVTSKGNAVRKSNFPQMNFNDFMWQTRKNIPYFFGQILPNSVSTLLPIVFVLLYVGLYLREKNIKNKNFITSSDIFSFTDKEFAFLLLTLIPPFILLVIVSLIPTVFATSGLGPLRSLTFVSFFFVLFIFIISFFTGYKGFFPKPIAFVFAFYTLVGLVYMGRYKWINELAGVKQYAKEYDARITYLQTLQKQGNKKAIKLTPLTLPPGTFLFYELKADSLDYINRNFRNAYHLDFDVYVE